MVEININSSKNNKKYIIFRIENSKFGVSVDQISQINKFEKVFKLPNAPDYVLGVINLRGKIISLIHLGKKLGLNSTLNSVSKYNVLFVDFGYETVGMLIGKVDTIKTILTESITDELDLISSELNMEFLKGAFISKENEEIIILLNLDMILTEYEDINFEDHRNRLKEALEAKEKLQLSEEKIKEIELFSDDFTTLGQF